jgi:hypothetical protein
LSHDFVAERVAFWRLYVTRLLRDNSPDSA